MALKYFLAIWVSCLSLLCHAFVNEDNFLRVSASGAIPYDDVIGIVYTKRKLDCARSCSWLDLCVSFSRQYIATDSLWKCILSSSSRLITDIDHWIDVYQRTDVAGTPAPCVCHNGGTCSYMDGLPVCSCAALYTGVHCETQTGCENPPPVVTFSGGPTMELQVINEVSVKVNFVMLTGTTPEVLQALSEGGASWSTSDIKSGTRVYAVDFETESHYLPMLDSATDTWYCYIDLPQNDITLIIREFP